MKKLKNIICLEVALIEIIACCRTNGLRLMERHVSVAKKCGATITIPEVTEYTKNSYWRGKNFYHGTTLEAANNIANIGVNPQYFSTNTFYGVGFYTADDPEMISTIRGTETIILNMRLNVKNPKIFTTFQDYEEEINNYAIEHVLQGEELKIRFTQHLQSQGYDAIQIGTIAYIQYLVFDPKQVVVIKSGEKLNESV